MTIAQDRPYVFIGSSAEGLPVAKAIQANLDHSCETQIWSQGLFGLSEGTLETLVQCLDKFDFAILAITPDDLITSRGHESKAPRDNVVFELGLFIGGLGRNRVFIVVDREARPKLPSDLAGITPATYVPPSAGNYQSALGTASSAIEQQIAELGKRNGNGFRVGFYATPDGDDEWLGITVVVTNHEPSRDIPPFLAIIENPHSARFEFETTVHGPLRPTQYRECLFRLINRKTMRPYVNNSFFGKRYDPKQAAFFVIGKEDHEHWNFKLLLEHSQTVLYENPTLGRAIGALIWRAIDLGIPASVELDFFDAVDAFHGAN